MTHEKADRHFTDADRVTLERYLDARGWEQTPINATLLKQWRHPGAGISVQVPQDATLIDFSWLMARAWGQVGDAEGRCLCDTTWNGRPSAPEPAPIPGGALVTPRLLEWLDGFEWNGAALAADLVRERDAFGRAKYGQGLSLGDGRDSIEDLRQELGDALQYAMKARLEGVSEGTLKDLQRLTLALFLLLSTEEV